MTRINARVTKRKQAVFAFGLTGLLLSLVPFGPALADEVGDDSLSIQQIIVDQLSERPGGTVVGNEIRYDDGVTFVAVLPGTDALSQCGSGRFCGWANANYLGSFYSVSGSGTLALTWTARSYSNNRSGIAHLYNTSATASLCFTPGQDRTTVAASYYTPSKVSLTSGTGC